MKYLIATRKRDRKWQYMNKEDVERKRLISG